MKTNESSNTNNVLNAILCAINDPPGHRVSLMFTCRRKCRRTFSASFSLCPLNPQERRLAARADAGRATGRAGRCRCRDRGRRRRRRRCQSHPRPSSRLTTAKLKQRNAQGQWKILGNVTSQFNFILIFANFGNLLLIARKFNLLIVCFIDVSHSKSSFYNFKIG